MRRVAQRKNTGVCEGFRLSPKVHWEPSSGLAHLGALELSPLVMSGRVDNVFLGCPKSLGKSLDSAVITTS